MRGLCRSMMRSWKQRLRPGVETNKKAALRRLFYVWHEGRLLCGSFEILPLAVAECYVGGFEVFFEVLD
jgi:hypothetical protein